MSDAARRLKANRVLEGKACAACGRVLAFGDDVAVCSACDALHDASCWDQRGGCATPQCVNAPLERLPQRAPVGAGAPGAPAAKPLPPGKMNCPHCGRVMSVRDTICLKCKRAPTPDGEYHGPVTNAPGAVASMVLGLVGLLFCGVVLGILAIVKSNEAKRAMAADPRYGGRGFATAGMVLGIVDLAFFVIFVLVQLGSGGRSFR